MNINIRSEYLDYDLSGRAWKVLIALSAITPYDKPVLIDIEDFLQFVNLTKADFRKGLHQLAYFKLLSYSINPDEVTVTVYKPYFESENE